VLHNGFFKNLPIKDEKHRWIYDYNDRSYYLLKALFSSDSSGKPDYAFRKIFEDPETYGAIRQSGSNNGYRVGNISPSTATIYNSFSTSTRCGSNNSWQECSGYTYQYQMIDPAVLSSANVSTANGILVQTANSTRVRDAGKVLDLSGADFNGNHNAFLTNHNWGWSLSEGVGVGAIVGVLPLAAKSVPHIHQRSFNNSDGYWRSYLGPAYKQPYPSRNENIFDNLGAGILFTPNYQQALGMDSNQIAAQNGVDQVPREWVQNILKDFLCREIPVIRQDDAIPHTASQANPKAPFRNGVSCMRCHASVDALSTIARNYQYATTGPFTGIFVNQFHKPTHERLPATPNEPDPFFPVRPAEGAFRYRDYTGVYHDVALSSSEADPKAAFRQFGQYLASMNDPYVCVVSKYFRYLTGISPKFFDPGDIDSPTLSERDKALREYLFALGKDLKQNGNLRKVVLEVVSSDLFLDPKAPTIKKEKP
jgi:hypothetical protein